MFTLNKLINSIIQKTVHKSKPKKRRADEEIGNKPKKQRKSSKTSAKSFVFSAWWDHILRFSRSSVKNETISFQWKAVTFLYIYLSAFMTSCINSNDSFEKTYYTWFYIIVDVEFECTQSTAPSTDFFLSTRNPRTTQRPMLSNCKDIQLQFFKCKLMPIKVKIWILSRPSCFHSAYT